MSTLSFLPKIAIILLLINQSFQLLEHLHKQGEELYIGVGNMNSVETQLPFSHSYLSLCHPIVQKKMNDNLGELFSQNNIIQSLYKVKINENEYCKHLCTVEITKKIEQKVKWIVSHSYSTQWYFDQLPAALGTYNAIANETVYEYNKGIPIGYINTFEKEVVLYNHFTFQILIHEVEQDSFEIVGFSIFPSSIEQGNETKCEKDANLNLNLVKIPQILKEGENISFTYDVVFQKSNLTHVSRWDFYRNLNSEIHWFGLINSNLIIIIFTVVVIILFSRALKKDIEVYNIKVTGDDFIDEFGWKQVCNDVFRKPVHGMILSASIGTGMQLILVIFLTLFFCVVGVLKVESRGNLINLMLFFFVSLGFVNGYSSAKIYKFFKGDHWLKNALVSAVLYPGLLFGVFCIINFFFAVEGSSATFKFTQVLSLIILWLCCITPLVLIGAFFGVKSKNIISSPCRINQFPTTIPEKPWYFRIKYLVWVTGLIPFAAVFIEFLYIMASIWHHQIYFLFGFLWIAFIVLVIVSSEMSIIVTFLCLCKGDYNWWWKSFLIGGSPTLYIIGYSVFYFFNLNIVRFSSIFIYFCLTGVLSSLIFFTCGTLGVLSTFLFLNKIYSMIKID